MYRQGQILFIADPLLRYLVPIAHPFLKGGTLISEGIPSYEETIEEIGEYQLVAQPGFQVEP